MYQKPIKLWDPIRFRDIESSYSIIGRYNAIFGMTI